VEELEDVLVALLNLLTVMVNYSKSPLKKLILMFQEQPVKLDLVTTYQTMVFTHPLSDLWDTKPYLSMIKT